MKTSASNRRLRVILTALTDLTLDPRPDFQRRLVWSNKDKVNFVKTVLDGFPFPEIYIAAGSVDPDTGRGVELLVDGQQRMTALHQYFVGAEELRLGSVVPSYRALAEPQKMAFLEYEVVVRDLGNIPIEEIKEIFRKINSTSYGLNAMEVHNARYAGAFKEFCEDLSKVSFFSRHRVFSSSEVKRMQDVRFCVVLAGTIIGGYFNRDKEAEAFLVNYNEEFSQAPQIKKLITEGMSLAENLELPDDSRLFKKSDLFTFLVEYARLGQAERLALDPEVLSAAINAFYNNVNSGPASGSYTGDVASYHKASLQGSNDRTSRVERGKIIARIFTNALTSGELRFRGNYIAYLRTLNAEELHSELDERISLAVQDLVDSDAVIAEMTETNTTSWDVDDFGIGDIDLSGESASVDLTFTVTGEQEDDKPWSGTQAAGEATAIIDSNGNVSFEDVSADRQFSEEMEEED
jgi:hypothetical protein